MKILLMSDSHGDVEILKKIVNENKNVDIFLHAGDSELPKFLTIDILTVKGNCDFEDYPLYRNLDIEGFKIHIEHGNRIRISDELFIENNNYDILILGHSHCLKIKELPNNKYIFNPGSLTRPRDSDQGSYIILELQNKQISYTIHRINIH